MEEDSDVHLDRNSRWADDAFEVYTRIQRAIQVDNSEEFASLIRSPRLRDLEPPYAVSDLGRYIFQVGAVRCAEAVLSYETAETLDTHFGLSPDGWNALHEAALSLNADMLEKLLNSGFFDPDLRAPDIPDLHRAETLALEQPRPLNVALQALRNIQSDCPECSAASLLSHIYSESDNVLDAIRLLAVKTIELHQEFFNYAKQGNMVEVGALLLAAGDKLLPLRISEGEDELVCNSFKQIKDFLQDNNGWSLTMSNDNEFAEWKETLKLLDIYDKFASQLIACAAIKHNRRSGMEVATFLQAQGFDVKNGHNDLRIDRLDKSSMMGFPQINFHGEISKLFPIEKLYPSNWMNPEPEQPVIPFEHALCSQSFARNMCTISTPRTLPTKSGNAMRDLISNKRLSSFMIFLRRGVKHGFR